MKCPLCQELMKLKNRKETFHYKGVTLTEVEFLYYHCNPCQLDFTTDWIDDSNLATIKAAAKIKGINETREG